jgi:2-dehydro-3-deoxygluconokinase
MVTTPYLYSGFEVVCVGETMGQFVPESGGGIETAELFTLRQAGAESNVAINLARLGHSVSWVSRIGDDAVGRRIVFGLEALGVDTSAVRIDGARATGVFLKDLSGGERPVAYYRAGSAASALDRSDMTRASGLMPRMIHTSGVTAALSSSCADAVEFLLTSPRNGSEVAFDVNFRPHLWSDSGDAAARLLHLADSADTVFVGLDEGESLWGLATADALRHLIPTPRTLVVKDAGRCAVAFVDDRRYEESALTVDVVEPVGAGDAFAAGYLHAVLEGHSADVALRCGHVVARASLLTVDDVGQTDSEHVKKWVGDAQLWEARGHDTT